LQHHLPVLRGMAQAMTAATIRAARELSGLTQSQAADLIGVSRPTWARWEAGGTPPTEHQWRYFLHVAGIERIPFTNRRQK
jgi:transcriptional regulator with XRE-family HTH domain